MEMERHLGDTGPNITNCTAPPLQVIEWTDRMVLVVVVLGILTLLTALINAAVIAAICTTKKLHLPANYLICSLAITDFLVAALVMPIGILYMTVETWPLGLVVCEVWLSVDMTCCTCSILHLCVIALDRYWAITNAIEYAGKRSARHAAAMVGAVWVVSIFISLPPLFWRHSQVRNGDQCIIEHDHLGYTIYSTFGAFYIPMIIILILYYRIYSVAKTLYQKRGSSRYVNSRSTNSQNSGNNFTALCVSDLTASTPTLAFDKLNVTIRNSSFETEIAEPDGRNQICTIRERKAARILGLILGAFIICWLPFFLKELLVGLEVLNPSPPVCEFLTWLGYINSLVNPLLYTSFNEDFKLAFKKLLTRKERA